MADPARFLERHRSTRPYAQFGLKLLSHGGGMARMECPVDGSTQNINGTLHGGVIALLVDEVGTVALVSADRDGRSGVTTDLSVSYFAPAKPPRVIADARALKVGRTLGFVQVDIHDENGTLVASGRMTKFMGS